MYFIFRLLVASQDGYLYIYELPAEGGECHLVKRHDFRNIELSSPRRPVESQPVGVPSKSSSSPESGASYSPNKGFSLDDEQ